MVLAVLGMLSLALTGLIWGNSLEGSQASNEKSDAVTEVIQQAVDPGHSGAGISARAVRKWAHFGEYMVLGGCVYGWTAVYRRRVADELVLLPVFEVLLTGVLDEYIQSFTGRTSLVSDILIDFGGGVAGIMVAMGIAALGLWRRKRKAKEKADVKAEADDDSGDTAGNHPAVGGHQEMR